MPTTATSTDLVRAPDGDTFTITYVRPGTPNGAGILLLQEIFGVGEFLLAKAEDLAELGYVVACPDVFWRIERGVALPHDDASMGLAFSLVERFAALDPDVIAADLAAALHHLQGQVMGRVGVMGYCLGGRLAYELGVTEEPAACVSYYGSGVADRLDAAGSLACPTLFHFGSDDPFIPNEQVDAIRSAFAARDDIEVLVQPGAGHAFENLFAPAFADPTAAAASWPRTVAFLEQTLIPER